jgi:BirA family biotin operon repressor/biotin-[acetyl-CoA-carboxylase] ligase
MVLSDLIDEGLLASAVYKHTTESTNSDAIVDLQSNRIDGSVVPRLYLADHQTAGRGRQGNAWISDDDNLTFSIVVDLPKNHPSVSLLSPAVGVAVARAIEFSYAPCRVALKWPNDLCAFLSKNRNTRPELCKLGGILIETAATVDRRFVIGIGLNLNRAPALNVRSNTPPASIADLTSREIGRAKLLTAIAESLTETLPNLSQGSSELIQQYRSRCALKGNELSLQQNDQVVTGYCVGVTDDGSLELIIDGRPQLFRSGDVCRVRPV